MKILIVSATSKESDKLTSYKAERHLVQVLVTGIGMVNSAYVLTRILARETFDLIIHIGVCGSYNKNFALGQIVHVRENIFGDMGATDALGNFLDMRTMGFRHFSADGKDYYNAIENPNDTNRFFNHVKIPSVKGLTVNTVNGDSARIESMKRLFNPDIESMEGAAIALVCVQECVPYFEFRSISNYVEPRDTSKWNLPLALSSIQDFTIEMIAGIRKDH